jgi:hypothetical protein
VRRAAGVAALAIGLCVAAGAPAAAQLEPVQRWSGTWDQVSGFESTIDTVTLSGEITYNRTPTSDDPAPPPSIDSIELSIEALDDVAGCTVPDPEQISPIEVDEPNPEPPDPSLDPALNQTVRFTSSDIELGCNGPYLATLTAKAGSPSPNARVFEMTLPFGIGVVPPSVNGLTGLLNSDRTTALDWNPAYKTASATPPDFLGYRIERSAGGGPYIAIGDVGSSSTAFTDAAVPAAGGEVLYRVRAMRYGPSGPDDPTLSAEAASEAISFDVAPVPSTSTTFRPPVQAGAPVTGSRPGQPGQPVLPRSSTAPVDTGYNPTLDYGVEPGEADAVLPDDELAAGSVIQRFTDDAGQRRALLVPVAAGLVLLGWAMHIRFLTRQAQPDAQL